MFIDVALEESSFENADLQHASFRRCDLTKMDFGGVSLKRTALSACVLVDLRGTPREPWDVRVTDSRGGMASEEELLACWFRRADVVHALGLGRVDEGQLYAAILDSDPALEESLTEEMVGYGVLARWFSVPRIYALPTRDPERMIYVGLVGELNGSEDALLLDGRPQNLASIAKAVRFGSPRKKRPATMPNSHTTSPLVHANTRSGLRYPTVKGRTSGGVFVQLPARAEGQVRRW
jgi:hypothetical protein